MGGSIRMNFRRIRMSMDDQCNVMCDVDKAVEFIESIYNIKIRDHFPEIVFTKEVTHSWYKEVHKSVGGSIFFTTGHQIIINERQTLWYTYERKSIGAMANGIKIPHRLHRILRLVHELTHLVQRVENRKASEAETTINEIRYVEKYHPSVAKKLSVIK